MIEGTLLTSAPGTRPGALVFPPHESRTLTPVIYCEQALLSEALC
jgi:hypothetical protein